MTDHDQPPGGMREDVLRQARNLVAAEGAAALTIQRVADAAGVSKGGLLHHFPSKRDLLDVLFAELLSEFSGRMKALMEEDRGGEGRFSRAYIRVVLQEVESPGVPPLWALGACVMTDPLLRSRWAEWYLSQLAACGEGDRGMPCRIARSAADGIWLARFLGTGGPDVALMREYLLGQTEGFQPPGSREI